MACGFRRHINCVKFAASVVRLVFPISVISGKVIPITCDLFLFFPPARISRRFDLTLDSAYNRLFQGDYE
jgi:hypothetical protein